jgi:hypothetical protein
MRTLFIRLLTLQIDGIFASSTHRTYMCGLYEYTRYRLYVYAPVDYIGILAGTTAEDQSD